MRTLPPAVIGFETDPQRAIRRVLGWELGEIYRDTVLAPLPETFLAAIHRIEHPRREIRR